MHRASTSKAFSFYKQSAQYQRPMHTASTTLNATLTSMRSSSTSMLRVSTANADITRLPYAWFLQSEYFHFSQYVSHSCHSARSRRRSRRIHPSRNYALPRCGMTVFKVPSPSTREVILHIKEPSPSGRGGTACGG